MSRLHYLLNFAARRLKAQSQSLLRDNGGPSRYGTVPELQPSGSAHKQTIGFWSAVFIIFNRIIGTGIFATPATVLALSGSVGLSMTLWLLGGVFAAAGMQVYIVWGCALPKNGGEKNYLQYLLPRPLHLTMCLYAAGSCLMGWSAANSMVFGEYFLNAILIEKPSGFIVQLASCVCVTMTLLLHGTMLKRGLRVQNLLGVFNLCVLTTITATGVVAICNGIPTTTDLINEDPSPWRGRENFKDIWKGTILSPSSICLSLNSVIYSFYGFSNANYAMAEMKNPRRTIRIVGPLAIAVAAALYLFSNVAYLSGASKEEIVTSGRLVVALLMKNVWGERVEGIVDMAVALAAFGSVLTMSFAQGRINQELAREGVLPFSKQLASNKPFNAPLAALGLNWFSCILVILFVPQGDAYNLVINTSAYPTSTVNAVISLGLLYLFVSPSSRTGEHDQYKWHLLSPGTLTAIIIFAAGNVFLLVAPFVPPPAGAEPYEGLPYWSHVALGWTLFGLGALWWIIRFRWQTASIE